MPLGLANDSVVKTHWNSRYAKGGDEGRIEVVGGGGAGVRSGSQAIRIKYPKEERGSADSGGTWESGLGVHENELYLAYWVRFDADFDFKRGGKLPGLGGTFSPFPANGAGDFRIRLMWREDGAVEFYLHDYALKNLEGKDPYRHWWNLGGQRYFEKGRWHHIEIHVKLNTPGLRDGILEGWFDGELAFRDTNSNVGVRGAGEEDRKLNYLCWHSFFGGGSDFEQPDGTVIPATIYWGPSKDVYANFDDFTVSRQRIGRETSDLDVEINAADFDGESHPESDTKIRDSGTNIGYIQNGTWVRYDAFDFAAGANRIDVQAASGSTGGDIEVRVDSASGSKLGTVKVAGTGGWGRYASFGSDLSTVTGSRDLYLVFKGGSGGLFNLKSFVISSAASGETTVDDTSEDLLYSGNWRRQNSASDYGGSISYSGTAGDSVSFAFTGVGCRAVVRKGKYGGRVDVYLDGVLVASDVDTYSATTQPQAEIYRSGRLPSGSHVLMLTVTGRKNAAAAGRNVMFDHFAYSKN